MFCVTLHCTSISSIREVKKYMNDYFNQTERPAPVNRTSTNVPAPQPSAGKAKKFKIRNNGFRILAGLLLTCITLLLVALLVYLFVYQNDKADLAPVQSDRYQAVFLNSSDGQVYFGKLSQLNKDYYQLTDIYYVRVTTVQPSDSESTAQQQISLAKLGSEIHGPEDAMYIAKDSVMFWENLKEDGQVVTAIREYQKNGPQTPAEPAQTNTTDTTTTESQ